MTERLRGGRRRKAGRPKVGRKVRSFRISEAVSILFDELKAEAGYLRDEDYILSLLNRERHRLSATRQPRTSTPESRSDHTQEAHGFDLSPIYRDTGIVNITTASPERARLGHVVIQ